MALPRIFGRKWKEANKNPKSKKQALSMAS